MSGLSVDVVPCGRSALVTVVGRLDFATAALLEAALQPLLRGSRRPRLTRLVVDLDAVPVADVVGLNSLLLARAVLARRQGALELRLPRPKVLPVLEVLGLSAAVVPAKLGVAGPEPVTGYGEPPCVSSLPAARSTTSDD